MNENGNTSITMKLPWYSSNNCFRTASFSHEESDVLNLSAA